MHGTNNQGRNHASKVGGSESSEAREKVGGEVCLGRGLGEPLPRNFLEF